MTTTEKNGARDEYFDQLENIFADYFCESGVEERKLKEKALSITYDPNVALQKRVEELESHLRWTLLFVNNLRYDEQKERRQEIYKLLNKQP